MSIRNIIKKPLSQDFDHIDQALSQRASTKRHTYPIFVAMLAYWIITFGLLGLSFQQTGGHFGYPLDDTYIHMAIARNYAEQGVWGITSNSFSSTTSSPLWTWLIAFGYSIFGVNDWLPLALNLVFGSMTLVLCYELLKRDLKARLTLITLFFVLLMVPLPSITLLGMEHTLHGFISIWFLAHAWTVISIQTPTTRQRMLLVFLVAILPITRYEGLFLILVVTVILLLRRRYLDSISVVGAALIPIAAYGLFAIGQGWYFLPNSVFLKGLTSNKSIFSFLNFLLDLFNMLTIFLILLEWL
ncbi:glycosyltransferase family 39 protein [Chloroflexus sp.]|uniref:glycosyltransferase family 39 protein n=1 Tax=Chloroflexus sp. TaxID=1904827 RepID=UPI0026139A6B|nr:glycosyltransferase family 39 protein [uncultured Chloroflexus sp.]